MEVDLSAVRGNVRRIKQISDRSVMAIVKANGYGHGLVEIARAAVTGGAAMCGVARIEEALALRQGGVGCGILVLGYTPPARVTEAIANHISLTVYEMDIVRAYLEKIPRGRLVVHAKVDTGMGRLGVNSRHASDFIRWLRLQKSLDVEGVFTHFSSSDEPKADTTRQQMEKFRQIVDDLRGANLLPPLVHAANSAAVLNFPGSFFNLVRAGISLYGLHPAPTSPLTAGFRPALSWKTRLVSVKILPPGQPVSYNGEYVTQKTERIGVLPVGYGDGFRRKVPHEVLINNLRAPVVGRVCMDQCMLQLDHVPSAKVGDEVVIIGNQGGQTITAENVAERWGTNNYEVVCAIAARVPRFYFDSTA